MAMQGHPCCSKFTRLKVNTIIGGYTRLKGLQGLYILLKGVMGVDRICLYNQSHILSTSGGL